MKIHKSCMWGYTNLVCEDTESHLVCEDTQSHLVCEDTQKILSVRIHRVFVSVKIHMQSHPVCDDTQRHRLQQGYTVTMKSENVMRNHHALCRQCTGTHTPPYVFSCWFHKRASLHFCRCLYNISLILRDCHWSVSIWSSYFSSFCT